MIEYTHVKIDGPYRLVANGQTLVCSLHESVSNVGAGARATSIGSLVLFVFGALLKITWAVLQFAGAALLLLGSELCWPLLREFVCLVGSALCAGGGWIVRALGAGLCAGGAELAAHSQLLRACARLRAAPQHVVTAGVVDCSRRARTSVLVARIEPGD